MAKKITDKVTWVGKIDWELMRFHGDELSTEHGSSYNAFLIRDKKTVLMDTVWQPYDKEFVARLKREIDLKEIDYIVMNHNEIDHSGALPELLREIPDTPIYCTKKGEAILRGHYHQDWNYVNVKTGDTLDLGESTLTFIEAPMLHWPDTMMSYLSSEEILFSNDVFGQHFATESLYNDLVKQDDLMWEAEKYYANIINTYSPMASRKMKELVGMNLSIKMICPSHGVMWKNNPMQIIEILTEMFQSKAVLVGSPTINYGYSYAIAGILEMARGLKFKNKKAAAFGSYGWSGDAPKLISEHLKEGGFELVDEGFKTLWVPDEEALAACREYGKAFAKATK